jgi:hypothetical protein
MPQTTKGGLHEISFSLFAVINFLLRFMPSVAKRKQKNTQNEQHKKMEREKEAKKKQERQQLPAKGKKR